MGLQTKPATFLAKCKKPPPLTPPQGQGTFLGAVWGASAPQTAPVGFSPSPGEGDGGWVFNLKPTQAVAANKMSLDNRGKFIPVLEG